MPPLPLARAFSLPRESISRARARATRARGLARERARATTHAHTHTTNTPGWYTTNHGIKNHIVAAQSQPAVTAAARGGWSMRCCVCSRPVCISLSIHHTRRTLQKGPALLQPQYNGLKPTIANRHLMTPAVRATQISAQWCRFVRRRACHCVTSREG